MARSPSADLSYAELALEYFYTRTYGAQYGARIGSMLLVAGVSIYFQVISWGVAAAWLVAYGACELTITTWWRRVGRTLGGLSDAQVLRRQNEMIFFCALTTATAAAPFLLNLEPGTTGAVVSVIFSGGIIMILAAQHSMADRMFLFTAPVPAAALTLNMSHLGDGWDAWIMAALAVCFVVNARRLQAANAAAEMAMVKAQIDADRASRAKSDFLATMSHEIRTPLNGVLGMTQVMRMDDLSAIQSQRLSVVQRSGEALLALLNDVLDMSKIEAGKVDLEITDFDLQAAIRSPYEAFLAITGEKSVAMMIEDEPVRGVFRGDPTRVRQIIYNLLSNAVKFTEQGEIAVTAVRTAAGVRIHVRDSGIGMPPETGQRMFEKFSQADATTTRRFGGTGLGLSICRELVSLMHGVITVESEVGKGSTFTVELPLPYVGESLVPAAAAADPAEALGHDGVPLRILVAEDNETNQLVLRSLLSMGGDLEVEMVGNGALAVEASKEQCWDVILMDVNMPVMDGLTATREIRAWEASGRLRRTPIVALTANAMSHQVTEYLAAGMDGHVAKPIQAAELFAALVAATSANDAAPVAAAV